MRKIITFLFLTLAGTNIQAQAIYESIFSEKLEEDRQLKILLPRGYDSDDDKKYPLIVVLDGDYLFEAVAGNVDYYSYWEDIPNAIIVGVKQEGKRFDDTTYSEQNSLPIEKGADFFEFLGMELLPYMENNYKLEAFKVVVGHGQTANYINYFLLKDEPLFHAYIAISPDLAPEMTTYLSGRFETLQSKVFYYLATSNNDVKHIKKDVDGLDAALKTVENKNLLYNFNSFDGPSHYALPAHAIPKALESIFLIFQPISKNEYRNTILKLTTSPVDYLLEKYETIEKLFGIDKPILVNDFKAIEAAIKKNEKWEYFEDLGKIARKEYPDTLLGHYYLARFYEEMGEPKKAMKTYRSAYVLEEVGGISKDEMLEKADAIKADFGY